MLEEFLETVLRISDGAEEGGGEMPDEIPEAEDLVRNQARAFMELPKQTQEELVLGELCWADEPWASRFGAALTWAYEVLDMG